MLKKIVETTANSALGSPSSRKLFKVSAGEYSGRMAALIQISANEIALTWADTPYSVWFSPVIVADDTAGAPFDAAMDDLGNMWLVYSEQSTFYLVSRKLTFGDGSWTAGNKTYVYNGEASLEPSVAIESSGKLWLSWAVLSAGYYDIHVKTSVDAGSTWGTGPSDAGDSLKNGLAFGHSRLTLAANLAHVIISGTGTDMGAFSRPLTAGGEWSSEFTIATGTGLDEHFDVAKSNSGLLSVVFDSGQLRFREFDGNNWSSVITLDENEARFPQLMYTGNVPVVVYLVDLDGQTLVKHTHRRTGSFSSPEILDSREGFLDSVILYDSVSSSYADVTQAAADDSAADVAHPSSGCLVKAAGDVIYVGMDSHFRLLNSSLSTPGAGGVVSYAYYDGSNWKQFTPAGGGFNLDVAQKNLILWEDLTAVPKDWQTVLVDGVSKFWVRVEVTSAFTTGPVGSRLTSASNILAISCGRT